MNNSKINLLLSPLPFFSLGFFYYFLLPFLVLNYLNPYEITPVEAVLPFLDKSFFSTSYFIYIFIIFTSFYFGYKFSLCFSVKKTSDTFDNLSNSKFLALIFLTSSFSLTSILLNSFSQNGGVLFSGYKSFDINFLGQLSTITFLSFFFFNFFSNQKIKLLFIVLIIFQSTLLLGLGSRNIVMNGFITALLGLIYFNKRIILSIKLYSFLLFFFILILFIGVWRTGFELKVNSFFGILFAEPTFVISSASLYLNSLFTVPLIDVPYEVFISVINFVPTFIYPEKIKVLNFFMSDMHRFSPFGASSVLVGLISNFGMLFFIYVFSLGILFGYLYKKSFNSDFYRSIYFSSLPLIIFQFYNQFIYSFFKLLIWNAILLPFIIFSLLIFFQKRIKT